MGKKTPKKSVAPEDTEVNTATPKYVPVLMFYEQFLTFYVDKLLNLIVYCKFRIKNEMAGTPKSAKKLKTPKKQIETEPSPKKR